VRANRDDKVSVQTPAPKRDVHVQPVVAGVVAVVAIAAAALAWYALPTDFRGTTSVSSFALVVCLVIGTVIAYQIPLNVGRHTRVYVSSVFYLLLAVLVPPALAATAAAVASLISEVSVRTKRGSRGTDIVTQASRRSVIVLLASIAAHLSSQSGEHTLLLIAAAFILGVGDILTFPLVVYRVAGKPPLHIVMTAARQAYLVEGAQYLVAVLGALAWGRDFWDLALLAPPTALVYLAFHATIVAQEARASAHAAAEALRESEQRYRALFENASDVVYTLDPSGRFTSVNDAATRVLGYSSDEILQMNVADVVVPAQAAHLREAIDGVDSTNEFDLIARDGRHVTLEVSSQPVYRAGQLVGIQGIARDVTERRRLEEERAQHARELSARILQAQEEERKRIARELHDETAQALSVLLANLDLLEDRVPPNGEQVRDGLQRVAVLARRALDQVRGISHDLRPSILDDAGLLPALDWLAREYEQNYGGSVRVLSDPSVEGLLSPDKELAIFRIAQEAMTNSGKHGASRSVSVTLSRRGSGAQLVVQDNGHGFDVRHAPRPGKDGHLGLYGIRERAALLDGTVNIASRVGQGTTVVVEIPLAEAGPTPAVLSQHRVS
jgi:PAS domain S-box-containing protein